ncbi:MAG: hypothetical protein JRN45_08495 [Nitrososphaerota archaeon]|nr:hypothetical protein [Nitrososphaerota archaeon]
MCTPFTGKMNAANELTAERGPLGAYYNTQFWLGLTGNFTRLAINVTAIAQNDTYGFGPAYLLNGLGNTGYWYQVGISWDWVDHNSTSHNTGFHFIWEVFDAATNKSILPYGGGSGGGNFSGVVNSGDTISLTLGFGRDFVNGSAFDVSSSARESVPLPLFNSTSFVGSRNSATRYPTSFLTEWYHLLPYYCSPLQVRFSNDLNESVVSWAKIDEWNFTGIPQS